MLGNEVTQSCKYRTKNCIEINGDAREMYNTHSQINFKTNMSEPGFCEYSDVYIHVKGTKKVPDAEADAVARQGDGRNKQVIFKNCAPFTDCLSEYTMAMYNSIKYRSNYLKTSDNF